MKTKQKGKETLAYKESVLRGLCSVIELNQRLISPKEKEKIDALQYGLTTRLEILVEESKHKEVDLKIETFNQVIKILKGEDVKF